jgi:cytochrome c biogenesis protein
VKVPDTGLPAVGALKTPQQLAFTGFFTPTSYNDPAEGVVSVYPAAMNPAVTLTAFVGNLHVNEGIPQNIYSLDTKDLKQVTTNGPSGKGKIAQLLWPGQSGQETMSNLPGGLTLSVDGVHEFGTFQVKSDPSKDLVLGAAIAIIAGLILSLRIRRRRVWARARVVGTGSRIEIGGLSRSDAEGFAAELGALTAQLRVATQAAAPGPAAPPPARPAADSSTVAAPALDVAPEDAVPVVGEGPAAAPAIHAAGAPPPDDAAGEPAATDTDENTPSSTRREP